MRMTISLRPMVILLCLFLLLGTASAMDGAPPMPPDGMMGPPPEGGPGGPPPGDGAPSSAAIVIADGAENPDAEYDPGMYSGMISDQGDHLVIENLDMSSGDYTFNGLVVTGPESIVRLEKATIRLGVTSPAGSNDKGGSAVNLDDGASVIIDNSTLIVDGAARYVTAAYNDAALFVNNSLVQSTGSNENTAEIAEPFSNEALLISGTARANFSIGATKTYYFNSTCTAEGWAALSTDSATGDGLDLYAYNTDGIAENGGYGTYADTNCRVWLFGSRLTAAEIGAIISKSGMIQAVSTADDSTGVLDIAAEGRVQYDKVDADSSIIGGRNAVMIHAPDMMGQGLYASDRGTFTARDTYLGTSRDLVSTKDYNDYGEAVGAYIDYVSGSDILLRSTSATITLDHVVMESYNGTLIHTVLNADSMGNFLAPGDGDQIEPIWVQMEHMEATGDIRHEDYQRRMTVRLAEGATLTGNILSGTMESWNNTWKDYGEVNWVVDESFDTVYGVGLIMSDGAVWNVTGDSSLTSLQTDETSVIQGEITLDGEPLIPEPGVTYEGNIRVTGNYTFPEEEPEPEEVPQEEAAPEQPEEIPALSAVPAQTAAPIPEAVPAEPTPSHVGPIVGTVLGVLVLGSAGFAILRRKRNR